MLLRKKIQSLNKWPNSSVLSDFVYSIILNMIIWKCETIFSLEFLLQFSYNRLDWIGFITFDIKLFSRIHPLLQLKFIICYRWIMLWFENRIFLYKEFMSFIYISGSTLPITRKKYTFVLIFSLLIIIHHVLTSWKHALHAILARKCFLSMINIEISQNSYLLIFRDNAINVVG